LCLPSLGPQNPADGQTKTLVNKRLLLEIHMLSIFRRLMNNDRGATAIEYTLIASLIAVAAIAAMTSVGSKVQGVLSNVAGAMT